MLGEIRFRSAGIRAFTEEDEPEDEDEPEEPRPPPRKRVRFQLDDDMVSLNGHNF